MDEIKMEPDGGVPVFYPTWQQFKSFKEFVSKIEPLGMQTGIVKIVPPREWLDTVPAIDDEIIKSQVKIKSPIEQEATGTQGVFSFNNILKRRTYSLEQWRKYCDAHESPRPRHARHMSRDKNQQLWQFDDSEFDKQRCNYLEASYWKTLGYNAPVYGADVQGSLFRDLEEWNVANLDSLLNQLHVKIPGVNSSYLYCGSWKASFAWHLEDMDLHSINYIHFGAPKQWYAIPQADRHRFYNVMKSFWPRDQRKCKEFLRHKNYMVSPKELAKAGVQVNKIVHRQGEFMITFPYGYHAGFNLGYNVAESVNFATDAWIPIGKMSTPCQCVDDNACFDVRVLLGEVPAPVYMTPPEEEVEHHTPTFKRKREERKPKRTGKCKLCPHKWEGHYLPSATTTTTSTDSATEGEVAHELCAQFIPETWVEDGKVHGLDAIPSDRFALRCLECKIGTGACFQCDHPTCTRSYHATCAASSGMISQNGQYICRAHRPRAYLELENDPFTYAFASALMPSDPVQCRTFQDKVFAGVVIANDLSEGMLLVNCFPNFDDIVEVSHQWVYPGNFQCIYRPPIMPKLKRKKQPKKEPLAKKPAAPVSSPALAPPIKEFNPEPFVPQNMHLYGVESKESGELKSPFVFMGVPLPACLQRTTPL